ncbi:MAG: DEAD/DEAH box helicase [Fusobacteriaceae bacterium]
MFKNLKFTSNENIFYRGEIPFFLKEKKNNIIYLCQSKKNMNDYYLTLKDFYKGKIIKPEDVREEDYINFNYSIQNTLEKNEKFIILCSLEFFLKEYIYSGNKINIKKNSKINLKDIIKKLEENKFVKNYLVEEKMQYSLRGDILDFFSLDMEYPARIEFFGDTVERITFFSIENQKTIEKQDEINLYMDSNKDKNKNFLSLFSEEALKKIELYYENSEILNYKLEEMSFENKLELEELKNRYINNINNFKEIKLTSFSGQELIDFGNFEKLKEISKENIINIYSEEKKRYSEIFIEYPNIKIFKYPLYEGFRNSGNLNISDRELKGIRVKRERKNRKEIKTHDINEIKEGDYIIHENFGVGLYEGMKIINESEYLLIKYAGEDKLFVPINNLNRIEKFIIEPGNEPEIYKLGRKGFKKKREKLKSELLKFALEIVEIQSKRGTSDGIVFSSDTIWQEEFEDGFPYNLTKDQREAIEDVKKDMESSKVMDRIVCGDVGCGKTEVAMRAAFKAIDSGKQVLLMVPTTVLAEQHYDRFINRFKNFPFTIEILSRLKSEKEEKEIKKKISSGGIDIIIGTHMLLSSTIKFSDLGLIIVDEEQKFGVKAKEKLKKIKSNADLLTLTATPIPRTLNLALLGIRDISIIETLPANRQPTKDFFIENKDEEIREAMMREFSREGQCFYIYNSVKGIERKLKELESIVPNFVKINYIHGQMPPKEIKTRISQFENGEIDILLSTTIIENGIDIENANTIIIEGIEKLGLSQMYQLRGRVGRGSERGYCYILVDPLKNPKLKSKIREEALKNISQMGDGKGFHLSLEDLRIRGAGEILGDKQHGALEILGYGLYMKLLNEEIAKIKGQSYEEIEGFKLQLKIPRYIPDNYIESNEKIIIYKRVAKIKFVEEIIEIENEIRDRFGSLPQVVKSYFRGEKIRIEAQKLEIKEIIEKEEGVFIKFLVDKLNFNRIMKIIESQKGIYSQKEEALIFKGEIEEFLYSYSQ